MCLFVDFQCHRNYHWFSGALATVSYSGGSKGGSRDAPPGDSKFFQFHAVFGKIWQNRILAPPGSWRPLLGEILDPPLSYLF